MKNTLKMTRLSSAIGRRKRAMEAGWQSLPFRGCIRGCGRVPSSSWPAGPPDRSVERWPQAGSTLSPNLGPLKVPRPWVEVYADATGLLHVLKEAGLQRCHHRAGRGRS